MGLSRPSRSGPRKRASSAWAVAVFSLQKLPSPCRQTGPCDSIQTRSHAVISASNLGSQAIANGHRIIEHCGVSSSETLQVWPQPKKVSTYCHPRPAGSKVVRISLDQAASSHSFDNIVKIVHSTCWHLRFSFIGPVLRGQQ